MKYFTHCFATFLLAALAMLSNAPAGSAANLSNLRCEYLADPLGIDVEKPRLSWVIEVGGQRTEDRGQKQTAYQVLVASTPELLAKDQGDRWDSGKVASDQSAMVRKGSPEIGMPALMAGTNLRFDPFRPFAVPPACERGMY